MAKYSKPKKKIENQETALQQFANFFMEMMVSMYVFILLVVYPLYYNNKYYDMGDAKYSFFQFVSFAFLGALILGLIIWVIANFNKESFSKIIKRFTATDWFAFAFFVVIYLSFLFSSDKKMAFYGFPGWNMGLIAQLIFVLLYFFVAKFWKWSPSTLIAGLITASITYFLTVIMRFGFDPLEMYENLSQVDIEKFVSTLGQTTWYSSYAVLLFPVGVYWYFNDDKRWIKIFTSIFIILGTMSLCTAHSDSAYIAFGFILLVFFWYAFNSNEKMLRFLEIAIMVLLSCKLVGVFEDLFPERLTVLVTGEEKISKFVTHSGLMFSALILMIILYVAFRVVLEKTYDAKKKESTFDIKKLSILRVVAVCMVVGGMVLVTLLIVFTTLHVLPPFLNKLYDVSFFVFDNGWGNHRGFNWRAAVMALKNASFKDLLIGVGPDCFSVAMDKYYGAEVANYWNGLKLACAHNEFLNVLVTEGILGLIAYVGFMVSSLVRCIKASNKELAAIFIMAIVLAYVGHNFFCYQQCICTPILFLFIGIGEVIVKSTTDN